jgi:MFS family permease
MDNTILNVALLPTLARDLAATGSQLQWMVDAYLLVFAGLLLTMGAAGDRFGRSWPSTPVSWSSWRPRQRRGHTEQRIAARVAALGFAEVGDSLADRVVQGGWLLAEVRRSWARIG